MIAGSQFVKSISGIDDNIHLLIFCNEAGVVENIIYSMILERRNFEDYSLKASREKRQF